MRTNPRSIIRDAGRRFPVRVVVAVPPGGFGQRSENPLGVLGNLESRWARQPNLARTRLSQRRHHRATGVWQILLRARLASHEDRSVMRACLRGKL